MLEDILDGQHPLLLLLRGDSLQQVILLPVIDGPRPHAKTTRVVPFLLSQGEVLDLELVLVEVESISVLLLGDDDPLVEEEQLPLGANPPATLAHDKLVLENDLPMGMDVSIVAAYHTERHGIIGPLGHVLHQLQGLLQVRCGHASLLGGAMHVLQEQLVLGDSLHRLDQEGRDVQTMAETLLDLLKEGPSCVLKGPQE